MGIKGSLVGRWLLLGSQTPKTRVSKGQGQGRWADEEEARALQAIAGEAVVGRWSRWRRQLGEGRCCNPSTSPLVAPWLPLVAFP